MKGEMGRPGERAQSGVDGREGEPGREGNIIIVFLVLDQWSDKFFFTTKSYIYVESYNNCIHNSFCITIFTLNIGTP